MFTCTTTVTAAVFVRDISICAVGYLGAKKSAHVFLHNNALDGERRGARACVKMASTNLFLCLLCLPKGLLPFPSFLSSVHTLRLTINAMLSIDLRDPLGHQRTTDSGENLCSASIHLREMSTVTSACGLLISASCNKLTGGTLTTAKKAVPSLPETLRKSYPPPYDQGPPSVSLSPPKTDCQMEEAPY